MRVIRKLVEIDEEHCDDCGQCVPASAEGDVEKQNFLEPRFCAM
jgi:NAD-dependent dihydropyrimidine dehydrogenase PreA subunit